MDAETLTADAAPRPRSDSFNRQVHGGRGLFSSMVFVFHIINSGLPTFSPLTTHVVQFSLRSLQYGVELFFCISGFVICGTLRRAIGPTAFLEDRAVRLLPTLWFTILAISATSIAFGLPGFTGGEVRAFPLWLAGNLAVLPGIFPIKPIHLAAWSLSYETCFYVTCAAAWALRRRIGLRAVQALLPLALLAFVFYPRGLFFLSGVLVAQGLVRGGALRAARRHPTLWLLLFLACWQETQELLTPRQLIETPVFDWTMPQLALGGLAFVSITIFFSGIVNGDGGLSKLLLTRPMQFMGTISYSFYLWHPIVMSSVKAGMRHSGLVERISDWSQVSFFVLSLVPALAISMVSQRLLERQTGIWLRHVLHHRLSFQAREVG